MSPAEHLLTVPEAARLLRLTPQTVRRYLHRGLLPARRIGVGRGVFRIEAADLALAFRPARRAAARREESSPDQGEGS